MKRVILVFFFMSFTIFAESHNLVVYYFGATSCGYCQKTEVVDAVNQIRNQLPSKYPNAKIKFVMVCVDKDIKEGIKFISKYDPWDEISIGSFYNNELVMNYLTQTKIPGFPHIIVFKDEYENPEAPIIKDRKLLFDAIGATQIPNWVKEGFPLDFGV